jgi:hypothetical protein
LYHFVAIFFGIPYSFQLKKIITKLARFYQTQWIS